MCKQQDILKKQLFDTALLVRRKLEEISFAKDLTALKSLDCFPKRCCQFSAWIYMYYLTNFKKNNCNPYLLIARSEKNEVVGTHAWTRIGKFHIDITGDQFHKDKVIVKDSNPWEKEFNKLKKYPFVLEEFDEDSTQDLERICKYIDSAE